MEEKVKENSRTEFPWENASVTKYRQERETLSKNVVN
jgi:hypothetical protein